MELHDCVCLYVIESGFYEISQFHCIHLNHALIATLVKQWKCKKHTFHLHIDEMTPTLQDVAILTGLLIDETHVTSCESSIDRDILCDRPLGWVSLANAYRGDFIKLTWLDAIF